jgi:Na+/proline symporter
LASIFIISLLTIFYTFHGGMAAVIWTDVVQMALYVSGALLSFWMILEQIPGGWEQVSAVALAEDKFRIFHFGFTPSMEFFSTTYTFWAGLLGGCFLTTATHGTDQLVVQRLLSARSQTESRLALLSSWLVIFMQFALFLTIGVMLYVFHQQTGSAPPDPLDRLYPSFVWNFLPPVVSGVVIAAIIAAAMSNISAALNSLASATIIDIALPIFGDRLAGDEAKLRASKIATLAWGAILIGIAFLARTWGSVLEAGLAIASVPLGALLGVFSLGVLTTRVSQNAALTGMAAGLTAVLYTTFNTPVAWTWYVVIGAVITFSTGLAASYLSPKRSG